MSESGTVVSVDGDLKVKDTIQATTGPSSSLKLKGVGTGGVEIMSADGVTDGKITLNCSQNSHGVTLQSPPHASGATYTLILPTSFGGAGDVLTSAGANPSQLVWTTPTTGTVTGTGTQNYVTKWSAGGAGIENSTIFDNGTNVGIGTTSPLAKTQISTTLSSGSTQNALLLSQNTSTSASGQGVKMFLSSSNSVTRAAAIEAIAGSSNDHSLGFYTNSAFSNPTEKMRIDSSGNVGIGTSSPASTLHVNSGTGNRAATFSSSDPSVALALIDPNGFAQIQNSGGNLIFDADRDNERSNSYIGFEIDGGSEKMRIDSTGNVGIGTTIPSAKLDVQGKSLFTADGDNAVDLNRLTSDGAIANFKKDGSVIGYIGSNTAGGQPLLDIAGATGNSNIRFLTTNTERIRITSSGNVGIGKTNPAHKLSVFGGSIQTDSIVYTNVIRDHSGGNVSIQDNGGNVGIGTTSPSEKLEVAGNVTLRDSDPFLRLNGSNHAGIMIDRGSTSYDSNLMFATAGATKWRIWNDGSDDTLQIRDEANSANVMTWKTGGNVGIGTSNPTQGNLVISPSSQAADVDGLVLVYNPDGTSNKVRGQLRIDNYSGVLELKSSGNVITSKINSSGNSYLNGGNVGIGTSSPLVSLDISATDAVQMPVGITNDRPLTGVSNGMLRYNSTNNEFEGYINGNWGSIGGGASGGLVFRGTFDASTGAIASGGSLYTCPAGGSGGTVDTAIGDLYIVTTAGSFFCSGTSLNVGDEVICITAATATNDNVNNWNAVASGAGGAVTGSGTTNYVPKFTGATVVGDSSIIDSSGKVGIGDIPSFKLDVNVTSSRARFKAASGDASIELSSIAGHDWLIQSKSDSSLAVYDEDEASERMRIDSSGNVGIGTTSPLQKLHVNSGAGNSSAIFESTDSTSQIWLKDSASSTTYQTGIGCFGDNLLFNNGGERMRIDSTGNVGIGGGTISSKLFVNTDNVGDSYFKGGSDNSRFLEFTTFATASPNAGHKINSTSINGEIALATGNTERMRISSSGNVGIGTSSPSPAFKTQLYDSGNTVLGVTAGTANYAALQFGSTADTTRGAIEYYTGDDSLRLKAGNNIEKVRVTSTGAISFGSTGTAYGTSGQVLTSNGNASPTWQAAGGGASTITTDNFSGNGTVGPFTLGATPSGGSTSFVDVFIDGVYQEISTYTVSGTALSFVVGSEPPTGTNIQTKTTSGTVSGALVSSVDIGQSSGNTGAVDLRIVPLEVTSGQTIPGNANSLYIFTATGAQSIATVTLPGSPTLGDSIKISNLGGLANVLGANGNKIMGVAADLTINTPTAAFEIIWSGSNNGWIIIGNV